MKVVWTIEAKYTYDKELEFILKKWNIKEVQKFIILVDKFIKKLENGILTGKSLFNNDLKSFVVSKQTTIFFDYHEDEGNIELLLFWNNSQDTKKIKKILSTLKK